jgi:hypothetical protein
MRTVVKNRKKESISNFIISTIFGLIPIIIIALVSNKNPNVWSTPYAKFVVVFLIINTYFAVFIGLIASASKKLFKFFYTITALVIIGLVVVSYIRIKQNDALLLHIATAVLFEFMIYICGEGSDGGTYDMRASTTLAIEIVGLINVLWFIGVNMNIVVHTIIVSIWNFIFIIASIIHLVNFKNLDGITSATSNNISYTEETEEEIAARKERERLRKEEKAEDKARYIELKARLKEAHDNDPDVIARKEKAEERKKKRKKRLKTVGRIIVALLPTFPGSAPRGSEDWDENRWGEYIADHLEHAAGPMYCSKYTRFSTYTGRIEMHVTIDAYGSSDEYYNSLDSISTVEAVQREFHSVCKHCPYDVSLEIDEE